LIHRHFFQVFLYFIDVLPIAGWLGDVPSRHDHSLGGDGHHSGNQSIFLNLKFSAVYPDPGSGAFFNPGFGAGIRESFFGSLISTLK
jgi:hypothetical protein